MSKRFQRRLVQKADPLISSSAAKARAALQNAVALHQRGLLDQAEAIYRDIRKCAAANFDATHLLGVILLQRCQFIEAEQLIAEALRINPSEPGALNNRGNALRGLGRHEEALASFDKAITLKPDYAEAFYNRGVALQDLGRFEEALASYERAIALRPHYIEALNNRGSIFRCLKRLDEALASYDSAIALKPDYVDALTNRGAILQELKRHDEALTSYEKALALKPNHVEALSNRGVTLHALTRYDEALASYEKVIALKPDHVGALSNRGNTLRQLMRHDQALASYERAIACKPDFADARFNRSLLLLLKGDYADGWGDYEWRLRGGATGLTTRNFECPQWQGEDLAGKTILLYPEQGYGDTIQFCRYVALVAECGARVILEVQPPLCEVARTLDGVAQVVSTGDALPDFDVHCSLLSLPLVLGTRLESIPSPKSYLRAPTHALEHWRARLGPRTRPRIGISWAGNAQFKDDATRSIGLLPTLPMLANKDVEFFSLQKDLRTGDAEILRDNPSIIQLGHEIGTFADTAAIVNLMDIVISSDTSVVHLAGSLGQPVWVLLQFDPDWRWLLGREDSPWYPTARLFRQYETRTWDDVILRVDAAIRAAFPRPSPREARSL